MNVKEAVAKAKEHVLDLFSDEKLSNIGLEEVEFDERLNQWIITIGFSRPWDDPRNSLAAIAAPASTRREYKQIRLSDQSRQVVSIKNRDAVS